MAKAKVSCKFWLLTLTMVPLLLFLRAGCSGYRKFTQGDGTVHFSFEYPSIFGTPDVQIAGRYATAVTTVSFRRIQRGRDEWPLAFSIEVMEPDLDFPNAGVIRDRLISELEGTATGGLVMDATFYDFKIAASSNITVDAMAGSEIVYRAIWADYSILPEDTPATVQTVIFDQGGLIWRILIVTPQTYETAATAFFGRIIRTFRILD